MSSINPVIIDTSPCYVCGVPAGTDCVDDLTLGPIGHGQRLDTFAATAPLDVRTALWKETQEGIKIKYADSPLLEELLTGCWPLTEEERNNL